MPFDEPVSPERIVSAAVECYGAIWSLPRPARHHHVLRAIHDAGLCAVSPGPDAQGFLTSEGRFVARRVAVGIAIEAGQIEKPGFPPDLYSEDLW